MKAIIIGAGIGGLTAGIALRQAGLEVTIYERMPELGAAGAGLALWPNALTAFDHIGVGRAVRSRGVIRGDAAIRRANGKALSTVKKSVFEARYGGDSVIIIHRLELMHILVEAAGIAVQCGRVFNRYTQDDNSVTIYFDDGSSDSADMLIGADGIHSAVRAQLAPDSRPVYSGYTAWRGVTEFAHSRVQGMWGESWGKGQRFGLVPLCDERVYWFATANQAQGLRYTEMETRELLLERFGRWHHPIKEVLQATPAAAILHHDIADIEPLTTWQDGRVVLLGDAAHAMTPNMGQGGCQAVEDAVALGNLLKSGLDCRQTLSRYVAVRQPRTRQIMTESRQIGRVGQIANPALCWLRDQVFGLLPDSATMSRLDKAVGYDVVAALP